MTVKLTLAEIEETLRVLEGELKLVEDAAGLIERHADDLRRNLAEAENDLKSNTLRAAALARSIVQLEDMRKQFEAGPIDRH